MDKTLRFTFLGHPVIGRVFMLPRVMLANVISRACVAL